MPRTPNPCAIFMPEIDKLEKTKIDEKGYKQYEPLFWYFVDAALVLLALEIILTNTCIFENPMIFANPPSLAFALAAAFDSGGLAFVLFIPMQDDVAFYPRTSYR